MPEDQNSSEEIDGRDEYLAKWEIAVLTSILLLTLLGNTLVLVSLYIRKRCERRKSTRMYFFMMHLSIADLLTGLLNVLPQLAWDITFRFQGGALLCKAVKFGQPLGHYLSSYILTATAIDRYQAICHPLSYCSSTSRKSRIMLYFAWVVALVFCLPQIFIFSYLEISPNVWDCWATFVLPYGERVYVTWYAVTVFLLPFAVLFYTYIGICIGIWRSSNILGATDNRKVKGDVFIERNRSTLLSKAISSSVKQTIIVVTLYLVTSSPFIGCQLWATWDPQASSSPFFSGPAFTVLTLLSSLTSCVNPWIYLSFNRELRAALMNYCFSSNGEYSLTYDQSTRRSNSLETSTKSTLISRISRLAGSIMFR